MALQMEKKIHQKTIGLIGGIGWASTAEYYRLINEMIVNRLGSSHSAKVIVFSLDQFDFTSRANEENHSDIAEFLAAQVAKLKSAGADFFCCVQMGRTDLSPQSFPWLTCPSLGIVEETARAMEKTAIRKIGLLGVRQTMAGTFYATRLAESGIETITPSLASQNIIHDIIYSELVHNRINEKSRDIFVRIIDDLKDSGAEGVILGCTEIPLLINQQQVSLPVFNTTHIHCEAAVEFSPDK